MLRDSYDFVLVGGGLANGLIAYRLAQTRPELSIALIEAEPRLGGNHTWSFFARDLTPAQQKWVRPFVMHTWPAYEVRFPERTRRLEQRYASVSSERFDTTLRSMACLGSIELVEGLAVEVQSEIVLLADGNVINGRVVLDGRGALEVPELQFAYQKFVGQQLRLRHTHGRQVPLLMDATVDQLDGYRFMYVLPFDDSTVLIEDTRYTDGADFDRASYRAGITAYAREQGWEIDYVMREEAGVLPIALQGDIHAFWQAREETTGVGLRGAFFHPTTGYSFADAVRLADRIATAAKRDLHKIVDIVEAQSIQSWQRRAFFRMVNRMLFRAAQPAERYRVLQRFYGLSEGLIARFYAGTLHLGDMLAIMSGKPPVPIQAALQCVFPRSAKRS